jgi:sulfatase maturation enzyme AslB (radical SAM superfamily)
LRNLGGHLGFPVISPNELIEKHKDANVFIAVCRQFGTVYDALYDKGLRKLWNIVEVTKNITPETYNNLSAEFQKSYKQLYKNFVLRRNSITNNINELNQQFLAIGITERCTLNCKYCAAYLPYISNKKDGDTKDIISSLDKTIQVFSKLTSINLGGGEPLLHTGLPDIIEHIDMYIPQIQQIHITTNGTIILNQRTLKRLSQCGKVYFSISNYGLPSQKIEHLKMLFHNYGIVCRVFDYINEKTAYWVDPGKLYRRNRSVDELKDIFINCGLKNCLGVHAGKLSFCPQIIYAEKHLAETIQYNTKNLLSTYWTMRCR